MNFLEQKSGTKESRLKCWTIIKFSGGLKFQIDTVNHLVDELRIRFSDLDVATAWKGQGVFIDVATSVSHAFDFVLNFRGFSKDIPQVRVWVPQGVSPKDFDLFEKGKPYVLTFYYDSLEVYRKGPNDEAE